MGWESVKEQVGEIIEQQSGSGKRRGGHGGKVLGGIVVLVVLWLASQSWYTIESGTVGVLSTFGEYDPDESLPGLHFKIPVVQKFYRFDTKLQTVNYHGRNDDPDGPGVINKPHIRVLDDKNLTIGMDVTIQFQPVAERADEILSTYGPNYFEKRLNAVIRAAIRDIAGNYEAETIATRRTELGTNIRTQLAAAFEPLPFELREVNIRDIRLPKIVTDKIEQVQQAKQEEQRLAMVKLQAQQDQLIKETQANTRLIEVTTLAKAEAEKRRIEADARAYAVLKEAEAHAEANRLIAASLTPTLVQYRGIERWNGAVPQTLFGGEQDVDALLQIPRTTN